ncbi:MAG: 2-hydroxyacyl-CoA dehydratase [Deferribacteraceae bacterium]|jgi:benzoyl-CoA reductase/2-hydroxyglutaryl-CoA dehydratase subunit BcrC/BadD/HgdB|nr:2-hydroxyacyl-CoA dehydratase [Deferribacteraceae bacterium]
MKVGITTTAPIEVLFAGGHTVIDLNNLFVTSPSPASYVNNAHSCGFPRSLCSWVKGQYSVVTGGGFDAVVAVTAGDCSNTNAMAELLADSGVKIYRFAYPAENNPEYALTELSKQIEQFAAFFSAPMKKVRQQFNRLRAIRKKLYKLDELTVNGYVSGAENHTWLVSSSDFNSDPEKYSSELDTFILEAERRAPVTPKIRLGYVGVPPVITGLYQYVHKCGAEILFNEVQRQFSIPSADKDICRAYLDYTYPYGISGRIEDICLQAKVRKLHGFIHYVQSFCHRQIHDILLKKHLPAPVLTIEGDTPGNLDERSKIRIESFIEMLAEKNNIDKCSC